MRPHLWHAARTRFSHVLPAAQCLKHQTEVQIDQGRMGLNGVSRTARRTVQRTFMLAMYSSMAVGPSSGSCQTVDNGGGESSTSYELVEQGRQAEAVGRALQRRCREG